MQYTIKATDTTIIARIPAGTTVTGQAQHNHPQHGDILWVDSPAGLVGIKAAGRPELQAEFAMARARMDAMRTAEKRHDDLYNEGGEGYNPNRLPRSL